MDSKKFDPLKLSRLNDPKRLHYLNPDLVWATLNMAEPKTLVDIGAGTGFFAILFSKKVKDGKVYACDLSDVMVSWMKENLPEAVRDVVIPLKMEENGVPLPDGVADLVYMINLHHELEEPLKALSEAHRLLRRGGKLMIIDWKKEETPEGPPLDIRVTEETISLHLHRSGFTSIIAHKVLPYHSFIIGEKQDRTDSRSK